MPTVYSGSSLAAPHPTIANLYPMITDSFNSNLILYAYCTGSPDTTADTYEHGAMMVQIDSGTGNRAIYENTGSSASPSWDLMGSIIASEITLATGKILVGGASGTAEARRSYQVVSKLHTGGTTPTSLFGSQTFPGSLTGIEFVSGPGLVPAGNIIVKNGATTIASVSNSATSIVGSAIAETAFASANGLTVEASGSGVNGILIATFITG